jgi:hypothetical protein
MAKKKPGKKKRKLTWDCPNSGRAFDLKTLRDMLEDKQGGFATFFFPVLKEAMSSNPDAIRCVNSYLAPTEPELIALGIPASQIESYKKCTDSGLLVAVIAEQNF